MFIKLDARGLGHYWWNTSTNLTTFFVWYFQVIPNYSSKDQYDKMFALGVTMYGQMTAGSYCYIGPQGIVHGTTVSPVVLTMLANWKHLNYSINTLPHQFTFSIIQLVDLQCKFKSCILIGYTSRGLLAIVLKKRNWCNQTWQFLLVYSQIDISSVCICQLLIIPFLSDLIHVGDTKTSRPCTLKDQWVWLIVSQYQCLYLRFIFVI